MGGTVSLDRSTVPVRTDAAGGTHDFLAAVCERGLGVLGRVHRHRARISQACRRRGPRPTAARAAQPSTVTSRSLCRNARFGNRYWLRSTHPVWGSPFAEFLFVASEGRWRRRLAAGVDLYAVMSSVGAVAVGVRSAAVLAGCAQRLGGESLTAQMVGEPARLRGPRRRRCRLRTAGSRDGRPRWLCSRRGQRRRPRPQRLEGRGLPHIPVT